MYQIINKLKLDHVVGFSATHAYVHWLADVHSGSFAPAFTLLFHDSECSRKPPMHLASVVMWHFKK